MSAAETLAPGDLFAGDFQVLGMLAQGGMGAVYVAHQVSTGQRRALKILHERFADNESMRQRFEQEARVAARIRSAHVVQTVGAGIDRVTGHPWLAMELLEGQTLEQHYPEGTTATAAELRLLMAQLGHGLGAAHDENIVHRDLKPDNIFLCRSQFEGLPFVIKLIDFGIAKQLSLTSNRDTLVMGSPLWMAPEQLDGRKSVSPATDVWALGLLAYRLLTGRVYWKTGGQAGLLPLMHEMTVKEMVPPSLRAREERLTVSLPPGFDEWFTRCLEREPGARYRDGRAATEPLLALLGAPRRALDSTRPSVGMTSAPPAASLEPTPSPRPPAQPTPPGGASRTPRMVLRKRELHTVDEFLAQHDGTLTLEGIQIATSRPLPVGTSLRLEVRVADEALLAEGIATVASASGDSMHLTFVHLRGPLVDELVRRARAGGAAS